MEVHTPNSLEYKFYSVQTFRKAISVKAANDAHVSFTSAENNTTPMVEIFLGGWDNSKSALRFNREKPDKVIVDTPGILSGGEHRDFVFEWTQYGTLFQVYRRTDDEPFLSWRNPEPFFVTHFGVRTAWGATGDWICDGVNYIETGDTMEYNYNPVEPLAGKLDFKVRAGNDAHVCLTSGPSSADGPIHEIFLGGWDNTKCVIRHNKAKPDVAEFSAPGLLTNRSYKSFWIDWNPAEVKVGMGKSPTPILHWTPRTPHLITHFGIRTGYGSDGRWCIPNDLVGVEVDESTTDEESATGEHSDGKDRVRRAEPQAPHGGIEWVASEGGRIPKDAVVGGSDSGEPIYVARAEHEGDVIPGKLVPSHGVVYVGYGGVEHAKETYEILLAPASSLSWVASKDGSVPANAVLGGQTENEENLFVGRIEHAGTLTVGKVHPSHATLYFPYGGKEFAALEYEVLVKI